MAGTLFVVATPIGNLEDITLRALRVLREANLIAAEDTRHTAKLLNHYGIHTPTLSFHAHNSRARLPQLIARLRAGETRRAGHRRGHPGHLGPRCRARRRVPPGQGYRVDPIPGASAAMVAAVGSGFPLNSVTILGFPPVKVKSPQGLVRGAGSRSGHACLLRGASSNRINARRAARYSWAIRQICVARELTKAHQEFIVGPADGDMFLAITRKGEFSVVVAPVSARRGLAVAPCLTRRSWKSFGHLARVSGRFWKASGGWRGRATSRSDRERGLQRSGASQDIGRKLAARHRAAQRPEAVGSTRAHDSVVRSAHGTGRFGRIGPALPIR